MRIVPRLVVTGALLSSALIACGGAPVPNTAPARESGQSALMASTYAGKHSCDATAHERPFIIEWDATDASSFQARAASDVVFVKYEGCNLTLIDSCSDDSVRGAYGAYKPIEWTSGAVERVDVDNVVDLYAKLPLGVALLGGRVESGEKFHMEYFVSGTRTATRPAVYRGELAKNLGCNGATHFVYGYNLGAFALGSRAKIEGAAGGTVWGAGAGGSSKYASAAEKRGGELASCRSESAKEIDACKVPIRLTLRAIADGDSPTAQAAKAPETSEAYNLASKLQATTDAERQAGEHYMAANTKMTSGDGRGCLAELDLHDRLDPRPGALSTSPHGGGNMRALCLMIAGDCEGGKQLARKSLEASAATLRPEDVDRMVEGEVAQYCREPKNDRDRFLRALNVLGAHSPASDCQKAYDTARRLVGSVTPRDNSDVLYDAARRIATSAPACFARAGDCKTAWRVAKEQEEAQQAQRGKPATDEGKRTLMWQATGELCADKDQGPLSDLETALRAIRELAEVRRAHPPAASYCASRLEKGKPALQRALAAAADEAKHKKDALAEGAAVCLEMAGDCTQAWRAFADVRRAFAADPKDKEIEWRTRTAFRDKVRECAFKPQGAMAPRESVYWAAGVLEDGARTKVEARVCQSAYDTAKRAAEQAGGDTSINSEWDYGTRGIPRYTGRCMQRAVDCGAAWTLYKDAFARFAPRGKKDEASVRAMFESDVSDCKAR